MPIEAMWKRVIRKVLELVVTVALIVFAFSRPNTNAGLRYFIDTVAVLFQGFFEGREAIYIEYGALRVKVSKIKGDPAELSHASHNSRLFRRG